MSNCSAKIIRTTLADSTRRIGEGRGGIELSERGGRILEEYFPGIHCETGLDGARFVPLREFGKVAEVLSSREQKAREEGFNAGKAAGLQEGHAEAQKVFDSFSGAVNSALEQRESILRNAETSALNVILKIARKVSCDSAKINVEVTAAIVKGAIEELVDKSEICVKVNPDHHEELERRIDEFKALSTDVRKLRIDPDPRIAHGGCFIHTPSGDIDARLESQLDVIEEAITSEES